MDCIEFIAISDIHGRFNYVRKINNIKDNAELLIIAGDITHFGNIDDVIRFLRKLTDLFEMILFIPGNCDPYYALELDNVDGVAINIHGKVYAYKGYYFYGIGGSNITPFGTYIEFDDEYLENMINKLDKLVNDYSRTIVITHAPPYNTLDKTFIGLRVGVKPYTMFLEHRYPILWISGHVHEARGKVKYNKTLIVNPGPFMKKYYSIIRLCNGSINIELRRF